MPRVLLVFEPPDGGVAVNVEQLATGLPSQGWTVEVAGPRQALVYERMRDAGVVIHRLPLVRGYRRAWKDATAFVLLLRLLRSRRYDVVHCHSSKAGLIGRIAAAVAGVPSVYSPHCFPFLMRGSARLRALAVAVERELAKITAATICVCHAERDAAVRECVGDVDDLCVVLNGCAPADQRIASDPALASLHAEGPVAAVITALRPQKRVDLLLEAVPAVLERVPEARIAVIGNGPLADDLREQARRLRLDERVRFLPFSPPAARYLRDTDVFVLPSDWEALAIGLLEAQASGVPQVATDVGGTSEVVTSETGILVPPNDPRALATALGDLLADAGRRRSMAAASRTRHARRFSLERMVEETTSVYAGVVAEREPR